MPQPKGRRLSPSRASQPERDRGFDFSGQMRLVIGDMCRRVPQLSHIDLDRVAIGYRQTRRDVLHGLQATLTPLRFEGGTLQTVKRGRRWTVQRLYDRDGREMLYILSFYLPRFLDQPLREKLITIVHELWHIGPDFDGDMRRHPGRCYAHSSRQADFDAHAGLLADEWLRAGPPEELYGFLRGNFAELAARHRRVYGLRIPTPKLIPIS